MLVASRNRTPAAIPFPAILDTGHTHSFALAERHLIEWTGLRPELLALSGDIRDRGQRIPLRVANLWVHTNESGSRQRLADRQPYRIHIPTGIAVYPGGDFPRLPDSGVSRRRGKPPDTERSRFEARCDAANSVLVVAVQLTALTSLHQLPELLEQVAAVVRAGGRLRGGTAR